MPSECFDESVAERYERFEFDFRSNTLAAKTVILAGGSGGLGAATAMLLAQEGARLVIGYRSSGERAEALAAAAREAGAADVQLVAGDLADEGTREALLISAGERLESLVVFAGDPARGADEATLRASLDANYLGPILLARAAADRLKATGTPGSVVLFSSMQGDYPFEGSTAYGAAKAALAQAALVLAKEVGGKPNIRVNVIAPGATMAGMAQTSLRSGKYDPFVTSGVVPRFGRAEDIARTVRFLIEPDNYVTGQVLTVDGGMTLRRDQRCAAVASALTPSLPLFRVFSVFRFVFRLGRAFVLWPGGVWSSPCGLLPLVGFRALGVGAVSRGALGSGWRWSRAGRRPAFRFPACAPRPSPAAGVLVFVRPRRGGGDPSLPPAVASLAPPAPGCAGGARGATGLCVTLIGVDRFDVALTLERASAICERPSRSSSAGSTARPARRPRTSSSKR